MLPRTSVDRRWSPLRQFIVSIEALAGEKTVEHSGSFEAPNVLSAVGQACLRFAVRTPSILRLSVSEVGHEEQVERMSDREGP